MQRGTHDELMQQPGPYLHIASLQLADNRQKAAMQSLAKSVSRIPTLRLRKTSPRGSTRLRTILAGQTIETIVRVRNMAVAATAVAVGGGDAAAAAIAAGASRAVQADETFPHRNTPHRRAANFADTTIVAVSNAMTIAGRKVRAKHMLNGAQERIGQIR